MQKISDLDPGSFKDRMVAMHDGIVERLKDNPDARMKFALSCSNKGDIAFVFREGIEFLIVKPEQAIELVNFILTELLDSRPDLIMGALSDIRSLATMEEKEKH